MGGLGFEDLGEGQGVVLYWKLPWIALQLIHLPTSALAGKIRKHLRSISFRQWQQQLAVQSDYLALDWMLLQPSHLPIITLIDKTSSIYLGLALYTSRFFELEIGTFCSKVPFE